MQCLFRKSSAEHLENISEEREDTAEQAILFPQAGTSVMIQTAFLTFLRGGSIRRIGRGGLRLTALRANAVYVIVAGRGSVFSVYVMADAAFDGIIAGLGAAGEMRR